MTCKDVSCPCHDFGNETNPKNICCDKCSSPNPITASRERIEQQLEDACDEKWRRWGISWNKADELLFLRQALLQHEAIVKEEMARIVENNKRKHFVFECGGAHGGRGCNETFCEDNSKLGPCTSEDAREVRKHNSTIDEIAALIRTTKPNV